MLNTILSYIGKIMSGFLDLIPDWLLEKIEQLIGGIIAIQLFAIFIFLLIFFGNTMFSIVYNFILVPLFPKTFGKKRKILNSFLFAIPLIGWLYLFFQILYSLGKFIYNIVLDMNPKQNQNLNKKIKLNKLNKFLDTQEQIQENNLNQTINNHEQEINVQNQESIVLNNNNIPIFKNNKNELSEKNNYSNSFNLLEKYNKKSNRISKFLK